MKIQGVIGTLVVVAASSARPAMGGGPSCLNYSWYPTSTAAERQTGVFYQLPGGHPGVATMTDGSTVSLQAPSVRTYPQPTGSLRTSPPTGAAALPKHTTPKVRDMSLKEATATANYLGLQVTHQGEPRFSDIRVVRTGDNQAVVAFQTLRRKPGVLHEYHRAFETRQTAISPGIVPRLNKALKHMGMEPVLMANSGGIRFHVTFPRGINGPKYRLPVDGNGYVISSMQDVDRVMFAGGVAAVVGTSDENCARMAQACKFSYRAPPPGVEPEPVAPAAPTLPWYVSGMQWQTESAGTAPWDRTNKK